MMNAVLRTVLGLIGHEMRAPGPGLGGWFAQTIMAKGNPPSIVEGIRRLQVVKDQDVVVELGAGHGVGLKELVKQSPKRVVAVEISERFKSGLDDLQKELSATTDTMIEIYGNDAKSMPFLENDSVDKMFAMNVVYFLDPLDDYLTEIHRVLKPNGFVVFGCKFSSVKDAGPPFVNRFPEPIIEAMTNKGFDVSSTKVELEEPMYSYVELKGIKKAT